MTTATYCSTLELARFMNILRDIPDPKLIGEDRKREEVGTGDNSQTRFFLDRANVISSTVELQHGASEGGTLTTLTLTTHYTLDADLGEVTLTSAGVTAVGTNKIFGTYSYIDVGNASNLNNTQLQEALDRAESEINDETFNLFLDGTATTPAWGSASLEEKDGKGDFDRAYYSDRFPWADLTTTADGAITADDATITVVSTAGFPSTGTITIGNDKIAYTGKTTTTFTGCTSVEAHDDGSTVLGWAVEVSTTASGSTPTWTVLTRDSDYDIDLSTGRVHLFFSDTKLSILNFENPPRLVPNRFRTTYSYGTGTIPDDIVRLCLMIASKDLMNAAVRKGISSGYGDFDRFKNDVDEKWIQRTFDRHRNFQVRNI